ncbi:MAG: peptidoglycan-binding protein [Clostridia bacterium]
MLGNRKGNKKLSMRGIIGRNKRGKCSNNSRQNKMVNTVEDKINVNMPILKVGSTGHYVDHLQKILIDIANEYPEMPVVTMDAMFGDITKEALIIFQKKNGLPATGVVDSNTWNKLHMSHNIFMKKQENKKRDDMKDGLDQSSNVVREGSNGKFVVDLQIYLNKISNEYISIPKLKVDGIFGINTKASVVEFQKLFKLVPDGIVGDITWNMIYEQYNKK